MEKLSARFDVIIAGGGIIGAASAFELSKQGLKVAVFEKNHVGFGASGASAAMLEFQTDAFRREPFFSLARASAALFPALHQEVLSVTGMDFQFENRGILQLALSAEDVTALQAEVARQKALGLRVDWMEAATLQDEFPQLSPSILGGAFFREDGQVSGEQFIRSLMKAAVLKGAHLEQGFKTIELKISGHRVNGIRTDKGDFEADKIVVACGAWTDEILAPLGVTLGLEPLRGQLVVFDTPKPLLPFPVYTRNRGYVTPKDGYTFAGSTVERVGFDASTTKEAAQKLSKQAFDLLPGLRQKTIRGTIAGLRPGSPDELPFIGPINGHTNVIVAAGHYRNGVLLAPITGRLVGELVSNIPLSVDLRPFSPHRFVTAS